MANSTAEMRATYGEDKYGFHLSGLGICASIVVVSFVLRTYAQHKAQKSLTLDNVFSFAAMLTTIALIVVTFCAAIFGGSVHTWRVLMFEDGAIRPDGISTLEKFYASWWLCSWIWCISYTFIKLSILAFLWRIFHVRGKIFRRSVLAMATFTVAYGITFTFEFIFTCIPVPYFWERAYEVAATEYGITASTAGRSSPPAGNCLPLRPHVATPLLIGLFSDVLLLAFPVVAVWSLRLERRKKLGILFSLSLGVFAIGLDIVRFVDNWSLQSGGDLTWNNMPGLYWNAVEFSVAYLCMCVPAMAPLIRRGADSKVKHATCYPTQLSKRSHAARGPLPGADESQIELKDVDRNDSRDSTLNECPEGNTVSVQTGPFLGTRADAIQVTHTVEIDTQDRVRP